MEQCTENSKFIHAMTSSSVSVVADQKIHLDLKVKLIFVSEYRPRHILVFTRDRSVSKMCTSGGRQCKTEICGLFPIL